MLCQKFRKIKVLEDKASVRTILRYDIDVRIISKGIYSNYGLYVKGVNGKNRKQKEQMIVKAEI